jgi:hypothetical protein
MQQGTFLMSETVEDRKARQLAEARAQRGKNPRQAKPDTSADDDDLIPDFIVARQRYQINPITLSRWDANPEMGFPLPIVINGRRYRRRGDLRAFEQRHVVRRSEVA